jgi:hypothetical protein
MSTMIPPTIGPAISRPGASAVTFFTTAPITAGKPESPTGYAALWEICSTGRISAGEAGQDIPAPIGQQSLPFRPPPRPDRLLRIGEGACQRQGGVIARVSSISGRAGDALPSGNGRSPAVIGVSRLVMALW